MGKTIQTNRAYALGEDANQHFVNACMSVGISPSVRQASKWRRKRGLAWSHRRDALKEEFRDESPVLSQ